MSETSIDVLVERIDGLKDFINEKFNTNEVGHSAILTQTTKTNGRVTRLETWQNKIIGGLLISQMIVFPILIWMVKAHLEPK